MTALRPLTLAAALLILPALAGCSRQEPEAQPTETNMTEEVVAPVAEAPAPAPAPLVTPSPTPTEASPDAAPIAPDEQMMDDAAATGMTARSERGDDTGDTGSATANVETE